MDPEHDAPGRPPEPGVAHGPAALDLPAAAAFLRRRLRRLVPGLNAADVDDLAQEALVDLVRTSRHETIRNVDALLNTLARRKAIDFVRRRDRWSVLVRPMPDEREIASTSRTWGTDPAERLSFVVLQFFAREKAPCEPLARAFLAGHDWGEVAAAMGLSEPAVRKQWSRCVAHLRHIMTGRVDGTWGWIAPERDRDRDNS